jgi:hypothetical protein
MTESPWTNKETVAAAIPRINGGHDAAAEMLQRSCRFAA